MLSNSHPNQATGCTSDNLTTSALSFGEAKTAVQTIKETANENGKYLGLVPNLLVVGTATERTGMEVTGSTRPVGLEAAGDLDGGTNVAAVTLPNYLTGGSMDLLVSPYITGNQWFVFATNIAGVKPFALGQFRAAKTIPQIDDDSPQRFLGDEYLWSVEADLSPTPYAWQCAYGSVTA